VDNSRERRVESAKVWRKHVKRALGVLGVLALFVTTVACSKESADGSGNSIENADGKSKLAIALTLAPTNLDIRNTSGTALEQVLLDNVYEGLLTLDERNLPVPLLADTYEVSDDALKYTFRIMTAVTFSNGNTLTAKDFEYSINDIITNKLKNYEQLDRVKSVVAQDDLTLTIEMKAPDANLLWNLAGRIGIALDRTATNDLMNSAIGTGPFTIPESGWVQDQSLTLQKNANYWGGRSNERAKVDEILIRYIPDPNAAVNALLSDDVQVLAPIVEKMQDGISDADKERFEFLVAEGSDKFVLAFNNAREPLTDIRVRKAIRYAIDHDEIIAARGGKADLKLGGPIPKLDPGYQDLTLLFTYDAEQAKSLLAEAGYNDTNKLKLTLKYCATVYGAELGSILTSQLAKVGIELEVINVEFATWLQDVYTNKDYDLSLVDHNEPRDFSAWANSDYYFGYDNPKVKELYTNSTFAKTDDEQASLIATAAKLVSQDAAADWLFNYRTTLAIKKGVSGLRANSNQTRLPLINLW
jgi:peptide/nickel transport system substrate-binding protein